MAARSAPASRRDPDSRAGRIAPAAANIAGARSGGAEDGWEEDAETETAASAAADVGMVMMESPCGERMKGPSPQGRSLKTPAGSTLPGHPLPLCLVFGAFLIVAFVYWVGGKIILEKLMLI
ncbi:MAG: hypothetical protein Q8P46_03245 [Hyphomicrobiales bacterium]|nr:hypothetical protein [Hyphomicrobiales bacterium]